MKAQKSPLPKFLKPYFWDVEFSKINPQKRGQYFFCKETTSLKNLIWDSPRNLEQPLDFVKNP